ncbi:MAG: amidohydrolase family protein [Steroidobacteraceae bacterium]|nr:amidohydrolase family protein [Steroidobacteraceae bacterium]
MHAVMGAFAAQREPARMQVGAPESFADATPKQPSRFCNADRSATQDLYDSVDPGRAVVVRDARVLTMVNGAVLPHHDVVTRDGRIVSVQPTGQPLPADAVLVDAAGRTLMPGLSDIHVHLFVSGWAASMSVMLKDAGDGSQYLLPYDLLLFLFLANGITRVEVMAGCPDTLWMRESVRSGSLVGPKVSVGSPLIDGWPPLQSPLMSYIAMDAAGGRRAGELIAELGYEFAKPYTNLPPAAYDALMETCHRNGIRVMGHVPKDVGIEGGVARGQQGIAHAAELFFNEVGPSRYDEARLERLARLLADSGTWIQATVAVTNRVEWLMDGKPLKSPDARYMSRLQRTLWRDDSPLIGMIRADSSRKKFSENSYELTGRAVRAMTAAGVRVLTGTDVPNPHVVEGFSLHEELQDLVEHCGMTPADVLHASTRRAAEYHGEGAADGTVAVGGKADLVLVDGDPLADIRATRGVHTVLTGRTLLRRPAIDRGLARVLAAYDAMPEPTIAEGGWGEGVKSE